MATELKTFRFDCEVLQKFRDICTRRGDLSYHINEAMRIYGPIQEKKIKAVSAKVVASGVDWSRADEIIDYLNLKAGTNYKYSKASRDCIEPRLKDFSIDDCKTVIDKKCAEWLYTDMAKYLRPATLFQASKFEGYLNQIGGTADTREQELDDWVSGGDIFNNGETIDHGHY